MLHPAQQFSVVVRIACLLLFLLTATGCDRFGDGPPWDEGTTRLDGLQSFEPLAGPQTELGTALEQFTASHTKVAWTRLVKGEANDIFHLRPDHQLLAFDSRDPRGERILSDKLGTYRKPVISPDGNWVVYTSMNHGTVWRIPFSGGKAERLGKGFALTFWTDPGSKMDYLYVGSKMEKVGGNVYCRVISRYTLWDLKLEEIWNGSPVAVDNFTLSRDGKVAGGGWPWPEAGIADLEAGDWEKIHTGCWPTLMPDNSGIFAVFDGAHRNFVMTSIEPPRRWHLSVTSSPFLRGAEVYHPRWSPNPRLLALTGPYSKQNENKNDGPDIFNGGNQVEILLARCSEDLAEVEEWFQLTDNQEADFSPYLWVDGTNRNALDKNLVLKGKPEWLRTTDPWPVVADSALLLWRGFDNQNDAPGSRGRTTRLKRHGVAIAGPDHELVLAGGWATIDGDSFLQATRDLVDADGFSIELMLSGQGKASPGTIFHIDGDPGYTLSIDAGTATLREADKAVAQWEPSFPDNFVHVVVVVEKSEARLYWNREQKARWPAGTLATLWTRAKNIKLGGSGNFNLHRLAFHDKALTQDDITSNYIPIRDHLKGIPAIERVRVRAELIEKSDIPSVASLGAYRDALTTYRYRVQQVLEGECRDKVIDVAHWGVLDRMPDESLRSREIGSSHEILLTPFDSQQQLASQRIEAFIVPETLYYDLNWAENEPTP